jgi:hypothetical protein
MWGRRKSKQEPKYDPALDPRNIEALGAPADPDKDEVVENWRLRNELAAARADELMFRDECHRLIVQRNDALAEAKQMRAEMRELYDELERLEEIERVLGSVTARGAS